MVVIDRYAIKVFLITFGMSVSMWGQQKWLNNIEFLTSVVDETVEEAMKNGGIHSGMNVYMTNTQVENDVVQFVLHRFHQVFYEREVNVFSEQDTVETGIVLSIAVIKADVGYDGIFREKFWGERLCIRTADISVSVRVLDCESQRVKWIGDIHRSRQDRIPLSELSQIERGDFLLGKLEPPRERGIRRWVEPIFVIATVGSVAYLFYAVRSQ